MDNKTNEEILKGQKAGFKLNDWHGQEIQTEGVQMVDDGRGKPYILRTFEFAINPQVAKELKEKKIKIDKQQIFNAHWPQIKTLIWSDGLVANQDVEPRIIVGKKKYRIFLLCEPKLGTMVVERPDTLQNIFNVKSSHPRS